MLVAQHACLVMADVVMLLEVCLLLGTLLQVGALHAAAAAAVCLSVVSMSHCVSRSVCQQATTPLHELPDQSTMSGSRLVAHRNMRGLFHSIVAMLGSLSLRARQPRQLHLRLRAVGPADASVRRLAGAGRRDRLATCAPAAERAVVLLLFGPVVIIDYKFASMGAQLSNLPISPSSMSLDSSPIQSLNMSPASTTRVFTSSESNYISRSIIAYIVLLVTVVVVGFWAVRSAGMRAAITQVRVANFG